MSETSEKGNPQNKKVEFLEPGVSIVKKVEKEDGACAIFLQICLAFLFMTIGVLVILYSYYNMSDDVEDKHHKRVFLNAYRNQIALKGVRTIEYRYKDFTRLTTKSDVQWLQDNDRQRILFNITDRKTGDYQYYFVFSDKVILATDSGCSLDDKTSGYKTFIQSLGLDELKKARTEKVTIDHKEPTEIIEYQGVPNINTTRHITGADPVWAFGFENAEHFLLHGWQTYFEQVTTKDDEPRLEWEEFWFPDIRTKKPDPNVFVNLPKSCYKYMN